ncbi:hypothetical protein SESBI_22711 [Sesbania bispinosa]|nr:hypothetical protein SESBI_22711 [Sesbania bispinosa]
METETGRTTGKIAEQTQRKKAKLNQNSAEAGHTGSLHLQLQFAESCRQLHALAVCRSWRMEERGE